MDKVLGDDATTVADTPKKTTSKKVSTPEPVEDTITMKMEDLVNLIDKKVDQAVSAVKSEQKGFLEGLTVSNTKSAQMEAQEAKANDLIKDYAEAMMEHYKHELANPETRYENVTFPTAYGKAYGGDYIPVGGNGHLLFIPVGVRIRVVPKSIFDRIDNSYRNITVPTANIGNTKGKLGVDKDVIQSGDKTQLADNILEALMEDAKSQI